MTIVLIGASGSGKSTIESELAMHHDFRKIVSYTTRYPRDNEQNGKDYYFVNEETFTELKDKGLLAEYDEYTQNRWYGTLLTDYMDDDRVVVLTPNGLRQLQNNCNDIFTVLVEADLGTRVKRYIYRCGTDKFNFNDANEIFSRINRDFGMFLGMDKCVDMVVHNNEGASISEIAEQIVKEAKRVEYERSNQDLSSR